MFFPKTFFYPIYILEPKKPPNPISLSLWKIYQKFVKNEKSVVEYEVDPRGITLTNIEPDLTLWKSNCNPLCLREKLKPSKIA